MDSEKPLINGVGTVMRVVISKTSRFIGRLSLQVVPSVTASAVSYTHLTLPTNREV